MTTTLDDLDATRTLVCGGRRFDDYPALRQTLDELPIELLIHGDAGGADAMAAMWAWQTGTFQAMCPAAWKVYGRSAGPRRNALMLKFMQPTLVVAFPGGKGTADMVRRAHDAGVPVIEIIEGKRSCIKAT